MSALIVEAGHSPAGARGSSFFNATEQASHAIAFGDACGDAENFGVQRVQCLRECAVSSTWAFHAKYLMWTVSLPLVEAGTNGKAKRHR
jgi:hypothetical protein